MTVDESSGPRGGLTEAEMRETLVRLVFGGDPRGLEAFCDVLARAVPRDTAAVLRGSSITGYRWADEAPFDADGPGTRDLDLTLVGNDIISCYTMGGFYIPGVHSKQVGDQHPDDPGFTFPSWDPHVRLDYAFVPAASADRLQSCRVAAESGGLKEASDHLPLVTEVLD